MKLHDGPFERIRSGKQVVESRLYDEKRRKINIGDMIVFSRRSDENDKISAKVIGLLRYQNFLEMFEDIPHLLGASESTHMNGLIWADSMHKYYTKEQETKYGVLGIRLKLKN